MFRTEAFAKKKCISLRIYMNLEFHHRLMPRSDDRIALSNPSLIERIVKLSIHALSAMSRFKSLFNAGSLTH